MSREMRDSGIEWIGQIPKEWKVNKIGNLYRVRNEKVSDKDYPPLSVTMNGIVPQLENAAKTNNGDDRKLVCKGDFAINSRSDRRGSCGVSQFEGSVSLINTILNPRGSMNPQYYNWLFHTELFADEFYKWGHGIVNDLWTTRWQEMKNISIVYPSLSEQQKIADYLDKVCGEVDELVALQEKMIEELKAYKQSVITETVTKGLNPNVPMKDSGIDWIGDIPKHWILSKAKFFVDITNGCDPKTEGDIPVYGSGASSFKTCGEYKDGPTVLIGRKGATLHIPHYIEGKYWNVDTAFDVKVKVGFNLKYYYYTAICFDYKYYVSQTTLPGMAQSSYNNMKIPVPSLEEQRAIASYLDTKCSEIDSLIALKQAKIEELKEYKKSVIYEYVTGKTEVI